MIERGELPYVQGIKGHIHSYFEVRIKDVRCGIVTLWESHTEPEAKGVRDFLIDIKNNSPKINRLAIDEFIALYPLTEDVDNGKG